MEGGLRPVEREQDHRFRHHAISGFALPGATLLPR